MAVRKIARFALVLLIGFVGWVLSRSEATPWAVTAATVTVLLLMIGIVLLSRRGDGD